MIFDNIFNRRVGVGTDRSEELVALLLEKGADPNAASSRGYPPLTIAFTQLPLVELLLSHGADPNRTAEDKSSPLFLACIFGGTKIARALLDNGADPYLEDCYGSTPLYVAGRNKHSDIVKLLLERGVKPKKDFDESRLPDYLPHPTPSVRTAYSILHNETSPSLLTYRDMNKDDVLKSYMVEKLRKADKGE